MQNNLIPVDLNILPGGGRVSDLEAASNEAGRKRRTGWLSSTSLRFAFSNCGTKRTKRPLRAQSARQADASCEPRVQYRPRAPKMYTRVDHIREALFEVLHILNMRAPYIPKIVADYLPVYRWRRAENQALWNFSHNYTISNNERCLFGVVLGSKLDSAVDHVINLRLDDGIEFGFGVATRENKEATKKNSKRDFMCEKGGWGYYNYKTKFKGTQPKYPAGWYAQEHTCVKKRLEADIFFVGDVMTMTVTRQGVAREGSLEASHPYGIMQGSREGNGLFTIRYFKNGVYMGHEFKNIRGPLYLSLNYYFMSSTLRLLSDYRANKSHSVFMKMLTEGFKRD